MRKSIVYHLNDRAIELNKELKPTHSKTLAYAFTQWHIAVNNLKLAIFDWDGKWTTIYKCRKLNESIKRSKEEVITIPPRRLKRIL